MQHLFSLYRNVAAGAGWRVYWLKVVLAGATLCGMLLSPKLWLADRAYPLTPVFSRLPAIPSPLDGVWFGTLLVLLGAILVLPRARTSIVTFLSLAAALCLWDQSRWQPWFYQYLLMLAPFACYSWARPEVAAERGARLLDGCRIIVAATYFWSGVQKLNVSFATSVYPWLVEPFLPERAQTLASTGALAVPLIEAGIGVGLLVPALRPFALALAVTMHAAILLCLGPWGHDWNTIVWPWNVAMPLFAVILFARSSNVSFRQVVWPGRSTWRWTALALMGILPGLSFVDRWDAYLSAALYSGNTLRGDLEISDAAYARLPEAVRQRAAWWGYDRYRLSLSDWAFDELNVPPYPARRVYRGVARSFADLAERPGDVVLVIGERPDWLTGTRETTVEDLYERSRKVDREGGDGAR